MLKIHPMAEPRLREARKYADRLDRIAFALKREPDFRRKLEDNLEFLRTFRCITNHDEYEVEIDRCMVTLGIDSGGPFEFFWFATDKGKADQPPAMVGGLNFHGPLLQDLTDGQLSVQLAFGKVELPSHAGWSINT